MSSPSCKSAPLSPSFSRFGLLSSAQPSVVELAGAGGAHLRAPSVHYSSDKHEHVPSSKFLSALPNPTAACAGLLPYEPPFQPNQQQHLSSSFNAFAGRRLERTGCSHRNPFTQATLYHHFHQLVHRLARFPTVHRGHCLLWKGRQDGRDATRRLPLPGQLHRRTGTAMPSSPQTKPNSRRRTTVTVGPLRRRRDLAISSSARPRRLLA